MKNQNITTEVSEIIISYYERITGTVSTPVLFTKLMEDNKSGVHQTIVSEARKINEENRKSDYDEFRLKNIPGYIPALNIKESGKANFTPDDFTGLIPLDIDDPNQDQDQNKVILMTLPWVVAVGRSVGGKGLFAIAKCDPARYSDSFNSAIQILNDRGIVVGKSQGNPNRCRYVTYDPDLYYNSSPASAPNIPIAEKSDSRHLEFESKSNLSIENQENDDPDIFQRIVEIKSGGAAIWPEGERHSYLIRIFTWCNKIGMSLKFCLNASEIYCRPMMEKGEGYDIEKRVNDIYTRYSHDHKSKKWNQQDPPTDNFWNRKPDGSPEISHERLVRFLETEGGFYNYYPDEKSKACILIRLRGSFIEESNSREMKEFLTGYIKKLPQEDCNVNTVQLIEAIYRGSDTYFGKGKIEFFTSKTPDFLRHTESRAYFPFKNGIVEINKDDIQLKPYNLFEQKIWVRDVIDFNITITNDSVAGEYEKFIRSISNNDDERVAYAHTLIGYLLHAYKDPAKPFAIVLGEETENEEDGGGTGKGIFIQGLSKLINVIKIDGKNFKTDKPFAFQRVLLNTRLVAIEDGMKNLDFESFYSIITEGVTIERKNKDEIFLPFDRSPKILFTTNYTISWTGNHGRRRHKLLEFSNFYSPDYTPEDHFKHRLFEDWDNDEWNRFHNYMFMCVFYYLNAGILEVENTESNRRKHIRLNYSPEFLEWWERIVESGWDGFKLQSNLYNDFTETYNYNIREYSQKKFTAGLYAAAAAFGHKLERKTIRRENNKPAYRLIRKEKQIAPGA